MDIVNNRLKKTVMIVGYGSVGQYLLDMLLHHPGIAESDARIVVVSRSPYEKVEPRINTSIIAGGVANCYPEVIYKSCDLSDTDKLSDIIKEYRPKVIVQCARFYSGVKYGSFSYSNGIGYGVWVPMSVVPIYKLMKAVKQSRVTTKVVNTSYPDVTNAWLKSFDESLTPYCGAGNINHLIPRIKLACKKLYGYNDLTRLDVELVCSHFTNTYVSKEGDPKNNGYILKINGKVLPKEECLKIFKECNLPMNSDTVRNLMIATDCFMLVRGLLLKERIKMHIPGVKGSLGGQRYEIKDGDIFRDSIFGNATDKNKEGLKGDCIEDVIQGGDVVFTDEGINKMANVFGISYPKYLNITDAEKFAETIMTNLIKYKESHNG